MKIKTVLNVSEMDHVTFLYCDKSADFGLNGAIAYVRCFDPLRQNQLIELIVFH